MSKPDRRVKRTEEALRDALLSLIVEKGFESLTVSEITERANVGRSTFYAHYADKDDLLQGSVEGLREFLTARMAGGFGGTPSQGHPALAFCLPMLEHVEDAREIFSAMVGRRGGRLFQEYIHDVWADFVRAGWPEADELAVQAIVGGFRAVILWWTSKAPKLSPAEVEIRFRALIEPALVG